MPYWDDRRKKLDAELARNEKKLFQRMRKYYNTEAARLDKEIAAYYAKYGENNVISYRRLMEQLSAADRQLLIERMEDFAKAYPQYAHLLPVRESIYKLNRLEGLRISIAVQQLQIGAREQAEAKAFFEQLALRYANAAAEQMGFGSSFYRLDHEMLRLVVGNNWCNGKDFSGCIWDNRNALTQTLQNEIVSCFIRGDDLKKTSRILQQKFVNVSQKNIERLVFTENSYLANEASIRVFEQEPNIQKYQFLATSDARTCEICNELNEQVFKISERSAGVNFPPMHPWCRCFAIPVWEEENGRRGLTDGAERGTIETSEAYIRLTDKLKAAGVASVPTRAFETIPTEAEIVDRISGGDLTVGSCASLAFAYAGNKGGVDVLDFRGGMSQRIFARPSIIQDITQLFGVRASVIKDYNDIKAALELLKSAEAGKEYILVSGEHAAVVRKFRKSFEYLELQDPNINGFKKLTTNALTKRFRCQKTHSHYGVKYEVSSFLIDLDSLSSSEEFKNLLVYINTPVDQQMKGVSGNVK